MSPPELVPLVITCPQCLKPVRLSQSTRVLSDGTLVVDHSRTRLGMVIHVTRGCVQR